MHRKLLFQCLENRHLLAADVFSVGQELESDIVEFDNSNFSVNSNEFTARNTFSATDAGSTRGTAANIGELDGTQLLRGSLGWGDRIDKIGFQITAAADVDFQLNGLRRDADLYLTDAAGNLLGRSTQFGSSSESIEGTLEPGQYFVTVVARTFWPNSYSLSLSAELETPVVEPTVPEGEADAPGFSGVQPLPEAAYFGSARDWDINAVGAPEAWQAGYSGQGVLVAVVDTGVDLDHPDLVNNIYVNPGEIPGNGIDDDGNGFVDDISGFDFADNDATPDDVGGHGTHVAGTIAAVNNGFGATGVAPDAQILPVRVLGANGSGSSFDVAAGIRYAADAGADIINLSLGGGYSRAIEAAIDYARSLGSFIVAAAGNESAGVPGFPARFSATDDNVISVGAFSSSGRIAGFSNDVGNSGAVQIDAPGVGVYSTYVGGGFATLSGTSMAAPHVAGVAALTLSANPDLTSRELRDLLTSGVVGSAEGSDALGQVSARTTVAYAAAGLTGNSITNSGGANSVQSISTDNFRVSSDLDLAAAPIVAQSSVDFSSSELQLPDRNFRDEAFAEPVASTLSRLSFYSTDVVDRVFVDYIAADDDSESDSDDALTEDLDVDADGLVSENAIA